MANCPGAPKVAAENGSYSAGLPAGCVSDRDTLQEKPTVDFSSKEDTPKNDLDCVILSHENTWTDAQLPESQYDPYKGGTASVPTPASVPREGGISHPAQPEPATPTPTVPESAMPESEQESPDGSRQKRGKSPTYFKFLGRNVLQL